MKAFSMSDHEHYVAKKIYSALTFCDLNYLNLDDYFCHKEWPSPNTKKNYCLAPSFKLI